MDEKNVGALNELRKRLRQENLASKNYSEVLNYLGRPANQQERDLAALCHYELSKQSCLSGKFGEAQSHATLVEHLKPTSSVIRSLNAARLKLLNTPHSPIRKTIQCSPGMATVNGIGKVTVLDKYVTYGRKTELTHDVRFLKKAPQELAEGEIDSRPQLIEGLGFALWDVLRRLNSTADVDLLVPIAPDPERYSIRMHHPPIAIAKSISNWSKLPLEANLLRKTRMTESLRGLSRGERDDEISGSMEVNRGRQFVIKDRYVLLVDDVVTYGTHFREAKLVLMQAGAKVVNACALAAAHGEIIPLGA